MTTNTSQNHGPYTSMKLVLFIFNRVTTVQAQINRSDHFCRKPQNRQIHLQMSRLILCENQKSQITCPNPAPHLQLARLACASSWRPLSTFAFWSSRSWMASCSSSNAKNIPSFLKGRPCSRAPKSIEFCYTARISMKNKE